MAPAHILIVDDDLAFREFACTALRAAGHIAKQARNGFEGQRALLTEQPDLLITEILMPERDGIELITSVRRAGNTMPILAMSGRLRFGTLDLLDLARHVGATATLPKPFTASELLAVVGRLLDPEPGAG